METHNTCMYRFKQSHFVDDNTLIIGTRESGLWLYGEIACRGQIIIYVDKVLSVLQKEPCLVQTTNYSYNVSLQGKCNIFRYDNMDDYHYLSRDNHSDTHHKHLFDYKALKEHDDSPIWIGEDGWPTLGEVIQEAENWYWKHKSHLSHPEKYPILGRGHNPPSLEL